MALAAAAGAEPEGQVVAFLGPHVLAALLLVPGARPADAVKLDKNGALPLVETLQMHPVPVRAELVVAEHPLVVVLLKVNGPGQAAAERGRTLDLWMSKDRRGDQSASFDVFSSKFHIYFTNYTAATNNYFHID